MDVFKVASQPYTLGERAGSCQRPWALYDAVKRPHGERPRQKS